MKLQMTNEVKGNQGAYGTSGMFRLTVTILSVLMFLISSCKKQEIENPSNDSDTTKSTVEGLTSSLPATSYVSVPDLGTYQNSPGASVTYGGTTYYGGPFQSTVNNISGSTISFLVKRTDGLNFPANSVFKLKCAGVGQNSNAGSSIVTTKTLSSAAATATIIVTESVAWNTNGGPTTNSSNFKNYVVTWTNPVSGLTFYTLSIRIVAVPTGWGIQLGTYNGVPVFSNGYGGFSATDFLTDSYGQKFQCVHYIKRYYKVVKNKTIGPGDAIVYWVNYNSVGLAQRVNNGAGIPQTGDIMCFKSSSGSYHVGIAGGVVSGKLRVYEENVGQTLQNGNYCSSYKDFPFTSSPSGYNVNASPLNGITSTWTTLGWVR